MKKPYVKPNHLSNDMNELKEFMDCCIDVHHWNEKRETAKKYFTHELISRLDGSGFINKAIRPEEVGVLDDIL